VPARVERVAEAHRLAVEADLAGVGLQRAGQGLDQAGLARAVVADDREHLAGHQVEVGAVERGHVAVPLDQAAGLEHRGGHRVLLRESWSTVTARITRMPVMRVW
jgi:hypothetical protein